MRGGYEYLFINVGDLAFFWGGRRFRVLVIFSFVI